MPRHPRKNGAPLRPLERLEFDADTVINGRRQALHQHHLACGDVLQLTEGVLADTFGVSVPTIARWLSGDSDPHPAMRKPIHRWIVEETARRLMHLL